MEPLAAQPDDVPILFILQPKTVTAGRTDMQSVVRVSANCVPTLSSAIGEKKAANLWAKRQWHILSCRATIASVVCLPLIVAKKENGLWNNFF